MDFFIWLEDTAVSTWVRESTSLLAFPFILYLHTLGLALIAGLSSAVALAIIVLRERAPYSSLAKLFPYMWIGFAINVLSGIALLIAYPAKALTNPVFYIKMIAIAIAVGILLWLQGHFVRGSFAPAATVHDEHPTTLSRATFRRAAWSLLGLWLIATVAGRMLAYTYSILMATLASFT